MLNALHPWFETQRSRCLKNILCQRQDSDMKRRELIRHIENHGCAFVREGANHTMYENPVMGKRVPIPRHREIQTPSPAPFAGNLASLKNWTLR